MTLMLSGFLVIPASGETRAASPAVSAHGTLEICKSKANAMAGKAFKFTVDGGSAITINGGACSGPMSVAAGQHTVVEAPTVGLQVKAIKANHVVSRDLSTGTVVVTVKAGSTAATETLITYVNASNTVLGLKICKASPAKSLQGQLFSFTLNGGPAFSVTAGTVAAPKCSDIQKFKLGTVVNVAELPTANTFVSGITVSDSRGSNVDTAAGTVTATIGPGVTIVTYTNNVDPPVQTGYVEVCKSAFDNFVTGSFDFTISDSTGPVSTQSVLVNQCTAPIPVQAGNVTVTEAARFPYLVGEIDVFPSGRTVSTNLANRSVTVNVPVSDSANETAIDFQNYTQVGYFKVCKALTANSGALTGKTFTFNVTDAYGTHTDQVVAGAAGSSACVMDFDAVPLGSHVAITEVATPNVQLVGVSVSPAGNDGGSFVPTANLNIGSGITTATFTNEADGTIEVCKKALDASTATQTFQFSVNGGAPFSVKAGQCSLPISVPAGTATVSEGPSTNFHLVYVTAYGPGFDNRLLSGTNPVTVSTPFGGGENETTVTFYDAVNVGQFKICKLSPDPDLATVTFNFTWQVGNIIGHDALVPNTCSNQSFLIPVVGANGLPIPIKVTEAPTLTVQVSSILVDNGTLTASDLTAGTATFTVKQGVTTITYTNVRTPVH